MATVLITGANRGIGYALSTIFTQRGDEVIAVCRHSSAELDALGVEVMAGIDVTEAESVAALAKKLQGRRLDVLFNNAGILVSQSLDTLCFDDVARQFEVNAMGPLRLTHALLGNLGEGSKIAMVTSRMGSMADNGSGGQYGYRMSKAALNAASVSLAQDLKNRGIAVAILHPGYVQTEMVGFGGEVTPAAAAGRLIARVDALNLQNTGTFWHANGEVLPW
ncbi:SDR family oxidoreductase [Dasania marina]|uniref:SDR family oxidoreductase n=1 Tax=Dasania marina TaxID=471499 RepID=UPI0030D730CC|tara:strand:+ start:1894 stop:2556 length:663 start_codon:yes stop_codon:yes gene_type:complete